MAEAAARLHRISDSSLYYKDYKDEYRSQPYRAVEKRETAPRIHIESKGGPRSEAYLVALLQAMGATFEVPNLVKQVEALAHDLDVSVEWVYQMALVEFIEAQGGDTKGYADSLRRASPFWQIHEYTKGELDALFEADELSPEMAERYKDLLED